MRLLLYLMMVIFLAGCGYKPVSKITNNILGDKVWVDVIMSRTDPQNTVSIKDVIREGIIKRLGKSVVKRKEEANSVIIASIKSLDFQAILYDEFGYVTAYKTNLVVDYKVRFEDGSITNFMASGEYDFHITKRVQNTRYTDSVISDKDRYDAIQNASTESFDEFISRLAIWGLKNGKHNK